HVVGGVVVAQLTIVPELDPQVVRVRHLVGGGDARAHWAEGVEGFAEPGPAAPGGAALAAAGDVHHACVAEYGAAPVLLADALAGAPEHDAQLGLVHEHPRRSGRG